MKRLLKLLSISRFFILSVAFFLLALIPFFIVNNQDLKQDNIQVVFLDLEKELNRYAENKFLNIKQVLENKNFVKDPKFNLHIYKKDSLVFWTTNKMPVSKYVEPQFPAKGRIQLQNGWYYGVVFQDSIYKLCASFPIKTKYSFTNEMLTNKVNPDLSKEEFDVGVQEENENKIYNTKGEFVFAAMNPQREDNIKMNKGFFIFNFIGVLFLIAGINQKFNLRYSSILIFFVLLVVLLGSSMLQYFSFDLHEFLLINQNNEFFEGYSLFEVLVLVWVISVILQKSLEWIKKIKEFYVVWIYLLAAIFFWLLVLETIHLCVEFSALTMLLKDLFSLKEDILIILIVLGILFYSVNRIFEGMSKKLISMKEYKQRRIYLITMIIAFFVLAIIRLILWDESIFIGFVPLVLLFTHLYFQNKKAFSGLLSFQLILIGIFSLTTVFEITEHYNKKDKETRRVLAESLFIQRDIELEKDYEKNRKAQINNNSIIKSIESYGIKDISNSKFSDILENKVFNGIWEQYEMRMDLVDSTGKSMFTRRSSAFEQAKRIVENHGTPINRDSTLYFIENEYSGYAYILIQPVRFSLKKTTLINFLKSKRIPENIGFPRLLISDNVKPIEGIENYSIAKYASTHLAKSFGEYNYQMEYESKGKMHERFYEEDGFTHFISDRENNNAVIISKKKLNWLSYTTVFSYLFTAFGIMLLSMYVLGYQQMFPRINFSLAFKIQSALVLLVVVSLILFGTGSGIFISNQYEDFTDKNINNKLNSIEEEFKSKISENNTLSKQVDGNYFESVLIKFRDVFNTDLNLYDVDGHLVASSRAQIFKKGLLSEQINAEAFNKLKTGNKSYFKHNERISNLSYISAYQPIYNAKGTILGYINLQHFGQQKEYENQIQQFVVALINVFILLIGLSIIMALFVSNWLTSPLRTIQEKLMSLELGGNNEKIVYKGKDEIGLLVEAYNIKIDELNLAIQRLAATERESAWREMAKQVAHEIKNPLTPMRLSIQQLLRTLDKNDLRSLDNLKGKLESIIHQIDGLANIANEFSNFAKMPAPVKSENDLVEIVKSCVDVFSAEDEVEITWSSNVNSFYFNFDKNQWIQIVNNILKNAIQAIEKKSKGKIETTLYVENKSYELTIKDNGVGMSEETLKMLFTPHFTTKSKGSGIGLVIVKHILENHNAAIEIDSKKGEGACIKIKGHLD